MHGEKRREKLLQLIKTASHPISGTTLSEHLGVSRQIVVQDIALIRAQGYPILSTNRGYQMESSPRYTRVFKVYHTDDQIEQELNSIVDLGATVEDVFVNHKIYGKIHADMHISLFLEGIRSGKSAPLKNITSGYHYHTVSAESEEILSLVEEALQKEGFLIT